MPRGRGSSLARRSQNAPVAPGSSAKVGAPCDTKMLGRTGSDMVAYSSERPRVRWRRGDAPTTPPSAPAARGLDRADKHPIDAAAIHVHHLEAVAADHHMIADRGDAIYPCHHEAAERMEVAGLAAGKLLQAGQVLHLIHRHHAVDKPRPVL